MIGIDWINKQAHLQRGLPNQVDLVLEDDDVLQAHDFHSSEMLRSLGLGAGLVGSDEQQGAVHNSSPVQHRCHENVVACKSTLIQ